MVAGRFVPYRPLRGSDLGQVGISWMAVPPRRCILAWRDRGQGFQLANGGMGPIAIVGTIRIYLANFNVDLGQYIGQDFAVLPFCRRHFNLDDVLGHLIDDHVNPAPVAAFAEPVLADRPLTFTEYLHLGRVDHAICGAGSRTTGNPEFQRRCPARHMSVVRYWGVQGKQAHQRTEQTFAGMVGQTEQGLERRAGLDGYVPSRPRLALANWLRQRPGLDNTFFLEPDGQVAAVDQSTVISRSIHDLVADFRLRRAVAYLGLCCHQKSPFPSKSCDGTIRSYCSNPFRLSNVEPDLLI